MIMMVFLLAPLFKGIKKEAFSSLLVDRSRLLLWNNHEQLEAFCRYAK